jgi:hypothetical protein
MPGPLVILTIFIEIAGISLAHFISQSKVIAKSFLATKRGLFKKESPAVTKAGLEQLR